MTREELLGLEVWGREGDGLHLDRLPSGKVVYHVPPKGRGTDRGRKRIVVHGVREGRLYLMFAAPSTISLPHLRWAVDLWRGAWHGGIAEGKHRSAGSGGMAADAKQPPLTPTQRAVLAGLAAGQTQAAIGAAIGSSQSTVSSVIRGLKRRVGCRTTNSLTAKARRLLKENRT